jgi:alpha-beta hydrolase superfamily lysophospholipase
MPTDVFDSAVLPATVTTRDGLELALSHWPTLNRQACKGLVCIVHGLGEHCGRYKGLIKHLNQWGWAVVSYDQRGHGRSPGPRGGLQRDDDLLHDLAAVIDMARTLYARERLMVLGHSMGGLVVARFVAALARPSEPVPWSRHVDLCVLSSPALDLGLSPLQRAMLGSLGKLTPDVSVGNGLKAEWVCSDASVVKDYADDPLVHDRVTGRLTRFMLDGGQNVLARAPHWTVPTLVQYAGSDRCVRPEGSARLAAALPARLAAQCHYEHMFHEIYLEPDRGRVIADLQGWLTSH